MSEEGKTSGKKWLGILAVCFLGIVLVAIAFAARLAESKAEDTAAQKEVQKRLATLQQAGQPVSFEDLVARYPDPPPEHDAELLLRPAVAALVEPKDSENLPYFGGDWPPIDASLNPLFLTALRTSLVKNEGALKLVPRNELRSAWVKSGYATEFTNEVNSLLPKIHSVSRVLCLDAVFKSVTGESSGAVKSLEKALLIAGCYKDDTILHELLKVTMYARAYESLNQILNRAELSNSDLREISELFPVINSGSAKELFINERAFGISEARQLKSMADNIAPSNNSLGKFVYRDQDLLEYLDRAQTNLSVMDLPLSNAIPKLLEFEKLQKEDEDRSGKNRSRFWGKLFRPHISFLSLISPPIARRSVIAEAKNAAYERAALSAIAVERYRLSHAGHIPENLSALVPEYLAAVPKDPFDDREMRFKKLDRGYAVYSVGADFTDDGGKRGDLFGNEIKGCDIVFSVQR